MNKTKKLFQLYVTGNPVTIGDDDGNEETLWIQKLNQHENESAYRKANAKRAKFILDKRDADSQAILELRGEYEALLDDGREPMVTYLANEKIGSAYEAREAELAASDEWSKDGYYQGLLDSWNDEMAERYARRDDGDEPDEEAIKVFDEMKRFTEELEKILLSEKEDHMAYFEAMSDEKLEKLLIEKLIAGEADSIWLNEYKMQEIYYACRDFSNHTVRYFDSRDELNKIDFNVLIALLSAYRDLNVELTEGKD